MRLLDATTEDVMVALFLQTEIHSERFAPQIEELLARDGRSRDVVASPNVEDAEENVYRLRLFGDFRGYGRNEGMFEGFPAHVDWYRASVTRDELLQVRYIDYSYWNELSQGTRLPMVAAETVRAGREIYGQSTAGFLAMAEAFCGGARFPELILTAVDADAPRVVMEGHARLTAYALAIECLPPEMEVLIGFSPDFLKWWAHGNI